MRNFQRSAAGFTVLELLVAIAIIGVMAALAVPSVRQVRANTRLKEVVRDVADAFHTARQRAVANRRNHIVYLGQTAPNPTDVCGNVFPVVASGIETRAMVLDDQDGDCCIDAGEIIDRVVSDDVQWGVVNAAAAAPNDGGLGAMATGSSFADPAGTQARWVLFRPDGVPVAVDNACTLGNVGTGTGGVYLNNGNREYAVVLTALGGVRVHGFEQGVADWND